MSGWQFGPYRVETLLGRGGMGEVYRAYDASHDRNVALKLLAKQYAADEEYQERFRRESRAAARLRDPHVIPIHRYGEIDGRLFIDMRLVEGDSLASVLAHSGPISPARTLLIVEQVASALDAAHTDGLIHRDVKPSNVLITRAPRTSNNDFVYLVDFGISRKLQNSQSPPLTMAGSMIGTPEYMAPERFVEGSLSHQADVYALACLIYECLTAQAPFPADDLPALIYAHVHTSPPRPSDVCPGIPESVDAVVAVGMAKDPTVRYSSAGELAAALRAAMVPSTPVDPPTNNHVPTASRSVTGVPSAAAPATADPAVAGSPSWWRGQLAAHWQAAALVIAVIVLIGVTAVVLSTVMHSAAFTASPPAAGGSPPPAEQPSAVPKPAVETTVGVGAKPEAVMITPDGTNAYVTNVDSKDISVIDTRSNKVITTILVPDGPPHYIAFTPDGRRAYATIWNPQLGIHSVAVIDAVEKKVIQTVPVGERPYGLAVTPDSSKVYVADHNSAQISVISTQENKVIAVIGVKPNPHWIAFSRDGNTAYVADHESNLVSVIDTNSGRVTSTIDTGKSPHCVAVSPVDGRQIYVTDYDEKAVTVIDAIRRIPLATVPVGENPRWVGYAPDGRRAYVINETSGTLMVIDTTTNQVTGDVAVGRGPTVGAVSSDGRHVYVVNQESNSVSVVRVAP